MCYVVSANGIKTFSSCDRAEQWIAQLDAKFVAHGPILPC